MPITAAEVESNGWVLRLTLTGAPTVPNTDFGAYALDPNGAPRVSLACSHPGFTVAGGQAVASALARTLVATVPLRRPVNPASPTVRVLDEADLGGGSIRVRLALSEHVYATDSGLTLAVLAGWRAGEAAASGIAVINGSTLAAPLPIMRWALAPYEVTAGAFRVSLFVASHHPAGFQPVAAVKFTATDGTNVRTQWVTALDTDNSYGDALRCYTAVLDPASAPALTAGLLRVDAEVYPWLGAMRTTDPAGTRPMTGIRTEALSAGAAAPWAIGYDPAGTRYGNQFVLVDTGGTTTASAAMVATTLAGARAVPVASRAANIAVAKQALYLANKTLPAANGLASVTRAGDGASIVLLAGQTHAAATASVTSGFQTPEIPIRIMGDPGDANPRANCLLRSGTANAGNQRNTKDRFQNLTLEIGGFQVVLTTNIWVDNCEVRARAGQETSTVPISGAAPVAGLANLVVTRSKWWRGGLGIANSGAQRCLLARANEVSRTIAAQAIFRNRWIGNAEDGLISAAAAITQLQGWGAPTTPAQGEDWIAAFNDLRYARSFAFSPSYVPAAAAGTPNPSMRRWAFLCNVVERIGTLPQPFYATGEGSSQTNSYNIIEGNSFAGDRSNTFYNDPVPATLAEVDSQTNQAFCNRVANNAFDWWPTKHDDFNDGESAGIRTANGQGSLGGYRAQLVDSWPSLFGVGYEGNYDCGRASSSNFEFLWPGLRSVQNLLGASVAPLYTADGSIMGPAGSAATGGGNYLPLATSPLLARVVRGNSDRDFAGTPRPALATAGAYEAMAQSTGLAPAAARSVQAAAAAAAAISFGLAPLPARHLHFADPSQAGWLVTLTVASARSPLDGAGTVLGTAAGSSALLPESARHSLPGGAAIILPDSGDAAAGTLAVTLDPRILFIR